ncbi:hypothetical protein JCM11491_005491 [Sporobolomyces phaffii]
MPTPVTKIATPPTPRETMAAERDKGRQVFDVRRMTFAMGGGERDVLLKERFMQDLERDPLFRLDDIHDLTKNQIRERTMSKFATMVHYVTNERLDVFTKRMELMGLADPAFWTRYGVHYGLFLGALRSGATSNQMSYWMSKGVLGLNGMVGCFGMTELAHGSNVAGLETTSTFDSSSDEFVVHTPSVSATKWWIGGAAHSATHCAVFAQMIIDGKNYGTKTFVVPLRNPKTYQLLPGIAIGDIGKKMGRDGIDNGWIQFTNVRIPRAYMLMKHCQVTRDGKVSEPALAQLTYGALLQGRCAMVADAGNVAKKALTIALRYAAVRRQFKVGNNELETQLLDYPIHQRRLIPLLSQAVAMGFTALRMTSLFEEMTNNLESLSSDSDPEETKLVLENLKETHATSAGLKAFCTWGALETIEKCRASLGGHGYSAYSGLPSMAADQAVQCTWEGDNTILTLQAGRSLISSYADAVKGTKMPEGTSYLNELPSILTSKAPASTRVTDLAVLQQAWDCVSANVVKKAHESFEEAMKTGIEREEALEKCSQERFVAAKVHTTGYLFRMFHGALIELEKTEDGSNGVNQTLHDICVLYGCWAIEENASHFLKYGFFDGPQMDDITKEVTRLCAVLRVSAVALTDSFNFSDHIINSPLGCYDGNVYEKYFNRVKESNPFEPVHPYFERIIKPLIEREPLELGDDAESMDLDEEIGEIIEEKEEELKEKRAGGPKGGEAKEETVERELEKPASTE